MKTVTVREFYQNIRLIDGLPEGSQLVVTSKGKAKFIVTKSSPHRMTRQLAESRAIGYAKTTQFDGVSFLNSLKK